MPEEISFISADNVKAINDALKALIESRFMGIELVEVRYFKQYGTPAIELLIWKKDGISLDDCEKVHNAVSDLLDEYDEAFKEAYTLNVSSLGLDRKIVSDDDYRRALDAEIECIDNNKKKTHGILTEYDNQTVVLQSGSQKKILNRNNLTKVQPYVRF